jgi:hypothetical protein
MAPADEGGAEPAAKGDPNATELARIETLLQDHLPGSTLRACERLGAGLHHHSYRVRIDTDAGEAMLVVRLPGQAPRSTASLWAEATLHRAAAAAGLAPELLVFDADDGTRICRWLDGEILSAEQLSEPGIAAAAGALIQRLQRLEVVLPALDLPAVVDAYAQRLAERSTACESTAARLARLQVLAKAYAQRAHGVAAVAAHNDLVAGNLLRQGDGLLLLDWEYACPADPLFDAATLLGLHAFTAEARAALLAAARIGEGAALETMVETVRLLAWAWAAAEAAARPQDVRPQRWLTRLEALLTAAGSQAQAEQLSSLAAARLPPVPQASIIVPAWNEAQWLPDTLAHLGAVSAECGYDCELIVVDNASTDDTAALALAQGARVVREPQRGIARARNAGAAAARGRLLVFVDADTRPPPALLQAALEGMASGRLCGGGAVLEFDHDLDVAVYRRATHAWNLLARRLNLAAGCFVFATREAFNAVGGFNAELYAGEEVFLSRRLARWGRRRGQRFEVLAGPAVVTSGRKAQWFSPWQHALAVLTILLFPLALRSRRLSWFWYRRPQDRADR